MQAIVCRKKGVGGERQKVRQIGVLMFDNGPNCKAWGGELRKIIDAWAGWERSR